MKYYTTKKKELHLYSTTDESHEHAKWHVPRHCIKSTETTQQQPFTLDSWWAEKERGTKGQTWMSDKACLLYTSDAADDWLVV